MARIVAGNGGPDLTGAAYRDRGDEAMYRSLPHLHSRGGEQCGLVFAEGCNGPSLERVTEELRKGPRVWEPARRPVIQSPEESLNLLSFQCHLALLSAPA